MTQLQDSSLLLEIKNLVRIEKETTAKVLEYLSVIDRRKLWVKEGYSSLFDFCVRYLNYSEGEAFRRIQAARITEEVEELKPLLKNNELSLTALSVIAPHITKANAKELIPKVINLPVRQIEKVLYEAFPESKRRPPYQIEHDEELEKLIEEAKKKFGEKDLKTLLKKALKESLRESPQRNTQTKKHTRYIQVKMRRHLSQRAGYQCEYKGPTGMKCNQTAHPQIDHIRPWAMGGSSKDPENLRILCKVHNLYKAKLDFPNMKRPWLTNETKRDTLLRLSVAKPKVKRRLT